MNSKLMKKDLENAHRDWWLRSASTGYDTYAGDVSDDGDVYDIIDVGNFYYGVASACLII